MLWNCISWSSLCLIIMFLSDMSYIVVQWLLLIVHAAITREVHSRVFRATKSRPGLSIHVRTTSSHLHAGQIAIKTREASHKEESVKIHRRRHILRLMREIQIISTVSSAWNAFMFCHNCEEKVARPSCFIRMPVVALMKKWEERAAWADTFQCRPPKNSRSTPETDWETWP